MSVLLLTAAAVVAAAVWLWLRTSSNKPWGPELPGLRGWGLSFKVMKGSFWRDTYVRSMEQFPKLMMFEAPLAMQSFMPGRSYFINDPELLNHIMLSRGYKEFMNHPKQDNRITKVLDTSQSLINLRDDHWKRQRKTITPSFHWATIRPMVETFNAFCEQAVAVVRESDGDVIIFEELVHKLTIDTIGSTSFGVNFDSLTDEDSPLTASLLDISVRFNSSKARALLFLPYWDYLPVPALQRFIAGARNIAATAKAVVQQRQADESLRRDDLLQILIDARDEDGNPLPETEIVHNAFLFLLAGEGTTAGTITWTMYEISQHPEVEEKLLQEIEDVLQGENPTHENLNELKYLDCVVKEVLRRHPAAELTNRDCSVDAEVEGHTFPKGTNFLVNIWAFHHNPRYFKDPMKFDPARFSEERKHELVNHTYLPFGAGPRKCIGFRFALAEIKVAIIHFVRNFHFEYASDKPPGADSPFNPAADGGMPLRVTSR